MGSKKKKDAQGKRVTQDLVRIKFVPKAGKWCKTTVKNGSQTQVWSDTEPAS